VVAGDVDPVAVSCAKQNGQPYGVSVVTSDLLAGFPRELRGSVQVVVANVPYVPDDELASMPVEARNWEPQRALAGGSDGLQVFRRLAAQAAGWLAPGGSLLTEMSPRQIAAAAEYLDRLGYRAEAVVAPGDEGTVLLTATAG
jgi:release factor glutamine methyltransferase